MARKGHPIFLDTEVFEAASFNFNTTRLISLQEQIERGTVRLILTDITVREVKVRIEKTVVAQFGSFEKFKRTARVLRSSALPEVRAALDLDAKSVIEDLHRQFDEFIQRTKAEIIDTSALQAGPVFEKYFANEPPFDTAHKKFEFPDAFVVKGLLEWTKKNAEHLYLISGDAPFRNAGEPQEAFSEYRSLSEALDKIVFADEVAGFIRDQILERIEDIRKDAKLKFEDRLYLVDGEEGEAEMSVRRLNLEGQPEIIEVTGNTAVVEVHFRGVFAAHLSYLDSSSGMYDSETQSVVFMDAKDETLDMEDDFVVQVTVIFEAGDPDSFTIEETSLVQPDWFSVSPNG